MATEKCLYAYDYVDLKDREYVKKHSKKRHLGDIQGKHRYRPRPSTATVVSSLVSLDLPEARAINTTTAGRIISDQRRQIRNTYQKTQWKETLNGWSRPSTSMDERAPTPLDVEQQRPHTSASVSIPDGTQQLQINPLTIRPFSTGAVRKPSRKPPQASGFMWVRMKRNGSAAGHSSVQFKRITEEIRLQWEEEDRRAREDHRKEKSQSPRRYDAFAGQWLSFAAGGMEGTHDGEATEDAEVDGGGGVVDAFTGKSNSEYYNIEGKVGANVATQLRIGNKIRIGVNGTVQSDSLRVRKWRKEIERAELVASNDSFTTNDSDLFKLNGHVTKPKKKEITTPTVPLCWDDQLNRPDVKVLEVVDKPPAAAKPDLSERHPVVFEKLVKDDARPKRSPKLETYRLSHRAKSKRNLDGTESLGNRITVITVDQIDEDRASLCSLDYEEILQRSLETEHQPPGDDEEPASLLRHPEDPKRAAERTLLSPFGEASGEASQSAGEARIGSGVSEKTYTPHCSPRQSSASSEIGLVVHSSATPKPRSMPLTSPAPSSPSIVSGRPRTGSQRSQRVQSSSSRGKYSFSQPPTPRNLHSPHPNLAKPGQLPRTGVSSINPGVQEGEHEYIKISQQIVPGSERTQSRMDSAAAIARVGERNALPGDGDDAESLGRNPSITSLDSMDSMNVEGDRTGRHLPDDLTEPPCSCSPEAKRAVSAALSRVSFNSSHAINIPTADMMNMSLSDLNSMSDLDPLASYSSLRGSLSSDIAAVGDLNPEEETDMDRSLLMDDNHDHHSDTRSVESDPIPSPTNETVIHSERGGVSSASSVSSQHQPPSHDRQEELGYIINQVDGLELTQTEQDLVAQRRKLPSAKKSNRTVTFAEEVQPPSVPNCTPESTPRDPTDLDSESPALDPIVPDGAPATDQRPTSGGSNRSAATDELSTLRSKIKSDLVETQQATQQDLVALETQRNSGKT